MAYSQRQPSNQSMVFDENQDSLKIKESLPSITTQQPPLTNILSGGKVNAPIGLRGGGACFDCLACICFCCAIDECCCDCCKNL